LTTHDKSKGFNDLQQSTKVVVLNSDVFTARHCQSGVTIVELLIVIVIASILTAVAAPSFGTFIDSARQKSAVSELVSDLNRARVEAIKRNSRVLVCVRNATDKDCGTEVTDWNNGWLMCVDADSDGACDSTEKPFVIHQALSSRLSLTGIVSQIRFNPNGTSGSGGNASLEIDLNGGSPRKIIISPTGNITRP